MFSSFTLTWTWQQQQCCYRPQLPDVSSKTLIYNTCPRHCEAVMSDLTCSALSLLLSFISYRCQHEHKVGLLSNSNEIKYCHTHTPSFTTFKFIELHIAVSNTVYNTRSDGHNCCLEKQLELDVSTLPCCSFSLCSHWGEKKIHPQTHNVTIWPKCAGGCLPGRL